MTTPAHRFRLADLTDTATVRELDDLVFPASTADQQPAEPGELEAGIAAGDIFLVESGDVCAGYLHADRSRPDRIYVAGVAIRPELQELTLGSALIDHMLALLGDERDRTPVVTVTSPINTRMLRALFHRGFSGRWLLPDHFGPGRHRLGCQLTGSRSDRFAADRGPCIQIPVADLGSVHALMAEGYLVRSVQGAADSRRFELIPTRRGDFLPADPPDHVTDSGQQHLESVTAFGRPAQRPGEPWNGSIPTSSPYGG